MMGNKVEVIFHASSLAKCCIKQPLVFLLFLDLPLGNVFWYCIHKTGSVLFNLPYVSHACFQSFGEYFIIYSYAELSVCEQIIKLSIQVSAGGTSSFLWSYCKPTCVIYMFIHHTQFTCGTGCHGLAEDELCCSKAKPVKFYPPSS